MKPSELEKIENMENYLKKLDCELKEKRINKKKYKYESKKVVKLIKNIKATYSTGQKKGKIYYLRKWNSLSDVIRLIISLADATTNAEITNGVSTIDLQQYVRAILGRCSHNEQVYIPQLDDDNFRPFICSSEDELIQINRQHYKLSIFCIRETIDSPNSVDMVRFRNNSIHLKPRENYAVGGMLGYQSLYNLLLRSGLDYFDLIISFARINKSKPLIQISISHKITLEELTKVTDYSIKPKTGVADN